MRVQLLGDISGTRDGQPWPPRGSTVDLPDVEAATLIRQNMARPVVDPELGVERAVLADPLLETRTALVSAPVPGPVPAAPVAPAAAPTAGVVTVQPEPAVEPVSAPLTTKTGPTRRRGRAGTAPDEHAGPTTDPAA